MNKLPEFAFKVPRMIDFAVINGIIIDLLGGPYAQRI
jgi:hypothetical protein